MKKLCFTVFIIFTSFSICKAFSFDLDQVDFNQERISLSPVYKIDIGDFSKTDNKKDDVKSLAKEFVSLSLSTDANRLLTPYMYVNSSNGFETINASIFIQTYLEKLHAYSISYDYIKIIRVVSFSEGDLAFVYINDAEVNGKVQDVIFTFWIKENKLFFPWFTIEDDLEDYFNEVTSNENNGTIFGGTFKGLSLQDNSIELDEDTLNQIYQKHVSSNVQLTGLKQDGVASYGSGFVIRKGVVVTSWSLLLEMLREQAYIYVTDAKENTYRIEGVVSLDVSYDVVILKLDKEIENPVVFGDSNSLTYNDSLFLINSNTNKQYSIRYGSFLSVNKGRLQNLIALNKNDEGSALYTKDGYVVGMNTSTVLYSPQSIANSTNYLEKLQNILKNTSYQDISSTSLDWFYSLYYLPLKEENSILRIPIEEINKWEGVGSLSLIHLPLVKSSQDGNYISLRYKNTISNSIESMYLMASYEESLLDEGYQLVYQSSTKKIYQSDKRKIIIKENMNYVILLIMEV